jgi:hypothetical protein
VDHIWATTKQIKSFVCSIKATHHACVLCEKGREKKRVLPNHISQILECHCGSILIQFQYVVRDRRVLVLIVPIIGLHFQLLIHV